MKKLFAVAAFLCIAQSFAQSHPFKISGTIQSEKDKNPIESATIHLERVKDSTVISYTISDEKGKFSLEGKSFTKNVRLYISFIGLQSYKKEITLSKNNFQLGTIRLKEENLLDEIVIKSRAPITIKKDTLEFNVKSFKTKKDANVEDLLKKLPGVEVDAEGKITVNGKPVNKILVNGKPFFGNDPSITTKNLTKEIIEKVQITNTKTKSEGFTGEKGDTNNKTINLTIKKENNKGWFGRVSAGAGTKKRYEGATMINRFDNNQRFSILASMNNINSPGFSFGEIQKMFGGGGSIWISGNGGFSINGRRFGGGNGIIKSRTAGATYADEFGKGFDVNANYFYSGSNSSNISKNNREYTIPDRKYFTGSSSNSNDENDNHSINLEFDIEIDSTFLINVSPNFVYNTRNGSYTRSDSSFDENRVLTNSFTNNSRSESDAKNFSNTIEITKKLDTLGSFIKASIDNRFDTSDSDIYNNSDTEVFGTNSSTISRNQYTDISNDLNAFDTKITYRYPLVAKKLFLDASYSYGDKEEKNINNTYDFNTISQKFSDFNTDLSSNFTYTDITKTPALELIYKSKKWRFNIETGFMNRTLKNEDKLRSNLSLERSFNAINLEAGFRYRFDSKASIFLDYELENEAPQLRQIQPFENVTNPLNIITGNPSLRPTQRHRGYINFNKFNWQKGTGMFLYFSASYFKDQIVSNTEILPDLTRKSTYTNTDGGYNFWSGGSYRKKVKLDSISNLKFRLGVNFSGNRNINILNNVKNTATTTAFRPSFGVTYEIGKALRIEPRYEVSFSNTKYNNSDIQNQKFTRHSLRIRTRTNVPKKLEWRNDIRYTFNPDLENFNQSSVFWNSTLSYSIFKDKASITLKGYDLLNQNTNAQRRATSNFIEDSESTVLQRYFMLGFSWKFNSLGKKGNVREFDFYH